jgi:hypothetical protein
VESGRARPSRDLLLAWLQELETPLGVRNQLLVQAGYAPVYSTMPLDDPLLGQANVALQQLLVAHDPMPAFIIDADWNLVQVNRGGQWLFAALVPWLAESAEGQPINLLDVLVHPRGFLDQIINLNEVGPSMLAYLRQEASWHPALLPKVEVLEALLSKRLGPQSLFQKGSPSMTPVLTTRYTTQYGELAFFSMFTTFGTPQDITLASLRVEHLFAADAATQGVVKSKVQLV